MLDTYEEMYHAVDLAIDEERNRHARVIRILRRAFPNYFVKALVIVESIYELERLSVKIDSSDTSMFTINGVYKYNEPRPRHYSYLRKRNELDFE